MGALGTNLAIGLEAALSLENLLYCLLGVFIGTFIGVLPGLGAITAIALLLPITYSLPATSGLILLAGIYYGASYGGSTSSILTNVPGTPSAAVTCLDGYPMMRAGRAGVALFLTAIASFVSGCIVIVLMMLSSPMIVRIGLEFGSAEYFSMMLLGLIAAASMTGDSLLKGLSMVVLGLLAGVVGMDMYTGTERFTFSFASLYDGISIVALAMGLFGIAEVITSARSHDRPRVSRVTLRSMIPTRDDWSRSWGPALRGTSIGTLVGVLPGVGPTVASFMAYAVERSAAKDPSRFGKGAVEGVVAPEAANNAAEQASFIPTMTLGIPGSATMALLLSVLLVQGIAPGPMLMVRNPDIFWGLVVSFWIGNIMLLVLNVPLIGLWVRMLQIPYHYLYPSILTFICIGVLSFRNNSFDIWLTLLIGIASYVLRAMKFPLAPLLLGFVLGPLIEQHFRRAMILSAGEFVTFVDSPISAGLLAMSLAFLLWRMFRFAGARRRVDGRLPDDSG